MNPADVAQSALPVAASADVSRIALFWQAHWIVKAVMLGLPACSVWVWAIAIDKIFLFARTRRSMDRFEQALVRRVDRGPLSHALGQADAFHGGLLRRGD